MLSPQVPSLELPQVGLFSWQVPENRLVADEIYAHIYGFPDDKVVSGLEIEEVLARIVPEDRERVARSIHTTILSGKLSIVSFRILISGEPRAVSAYGRCLRDRDGIPSVFVGGVVAGRKITFEQSCHAIH